VKRSAALMDSQMGNIGTSRIDGIDEPREEDVAASDNLAERNSDTERKMESPNSCSSIAMDADDGSEFFLCVICLELVYKPVVQSCGHVFCFWCVHRAMNSDRESYCSLCRSPYNHFPRVCELLHFLLLKAFPEDYRLREKQIQEEERKMQKFSPEFDDPQTAQIMYGSKLNSSETTANFSERESLQEDSLSESSIATKSMDSIFSSGTIRKGAESMHTSSLCKESVSVNVETSVTINNLEANDGPEGVASETTKDQANASNHVSFNKVTVDDALCCCCKRLLYHPIVLNCGHAFCQSCIKISEERTVNCQVCPSIHPGDRPSVCLELHQFLEQTFPVEYAERKKSVIAQEKIQQPREEDCQRSTKEAVRTTAEMPEIHRDVGCDYCGVIPIVGTRYKCLNCHESIGFDLCGTCYEKGLVLPGRFNQQHTSEHRFQAITMTRDDEYQRPILPVFIHQLSGRSSIILMAEEDIEDSMMHNSAESSENSERNQTESDED